MQVKEIMSCSVRAVNPDTPIVEVASLMCLYRFSTLPVVEDGNRLVGVIAEKDVLHRLFPTLDDMIDGTMVLDYDEMMKRYRDVLHLHVSDLMNRNVHTVQPDMHILKAATVMVRHRFRRIPVSEAGHVVGMLSLGDVHKAIFHANMAGKLG